MKINRNLNLVVPVENENGTTIYVHATPISREVFDQFFYVIGKTFTAIYMGGFGVAAGPRLAAKMLRKVARELGPAQLDEVEKGLIPEIKRLSNVIAPAGAGWGPMPLDTAISSGTISADDADEVENAVTFFIVASAMHLKKDAREILPEAAKLWSAQTTSLTSTQFAASLPTSTPVASTGEKVQASSIPS